MQYRKLGKTNLDVSVLGFGGIMMMNMKQEKAQELVAMAVDNGINLFDVGPTYGNSEEILGPAVQKYRDDIVLTCKTEPDNNKKEVMTDLKSSLQKLNTNYFDIYQLHEVTDDASLKKALDVGGALETIEEAARSGLIRYIGFSAHSQKYALKLIEVFDFDTVMFPINWNYWFNSNQGEEVIKKAKEKNMGIMAIKALAHRKWFDNEERNGFNTWYKPLYDNQELAELALRFTLTKDIDTAISPGDARMLKKGLEIINKFDSDLTLSNDEQEKLVEYAENVKKNLYPMP